MYKKKSDSTAPTSQAESLNGFIFDSSKDFILQTIWIFRRIASASEGDSRVAIGTLRIVAEDAENQDLDSVTDGLIEKALPRAITRSTERNIGMLSPHQKLIIEILNLEQSLDGGELFKRFQKASDQRGLRRITDRGFRNHIEKLVHLDLVSTEGRGRWKNYSINQPTKP